MDIKSILVPKSPPPAHKPGPEMATTPKDNPDCALDLSCKPTSGDAPLDLTLELRAKQTVPLVSAPPVPVPASPDDDVIVVDVKRGRGSNAQGALPNSPVPNRTVYNMCQKETYTGGVAYTPFDLSSGLIKLKRMIRMAKDPQQARQMAQAFQKKAVQMILKSRIQQQQRQQGKTESGALASTSASIGSRLFMPNRPPPSAALGRPLNMDGNSSSMSPSTSGPANYSRVSSEGSLVSSSPSLGPSGPAGLTSSEPLTSVPMIQPVLVVTSMNTISGQNSTTQVTPGNFGSSTPTQSDRSLHPALAHRSIPSVTMASMSVSYSSVTTANSHPSTTVTSPSVGSSHSAFRPSNPMPKVSSAGNFESEYMKYVRSKRFMSGGSNITEERKVPNSKPELLKLENTSAAAKRMVKPNMAEYQFLSEISKVAKQALQMAENFPRDKRRDESTQAIKISDIMSPPPAHSKITVSVNHKMPHRNPHLLRCPPLRPSHPRGQMMSNKYLSQIGGQMSKPAQTRPNVQPTKVTSPQKQVETTAVAATVSAINRPIVANVKTWTPPIEKKSFVKQVINEDNMKDVKELIRIPHYRFNDLKSPMKNDREEFQRIYSTGEEMESSANNQSSYFNSPTANNPFQPEGRNTVVDLNGKDKNGPNIPNNGLASMNTGIDMHGRDTTRLSPGLSVRDKGSTSLIIPPPVTKVIAPIPTSTDNIPLPCNMATTISINTTTSMQKDMADCSLTSASTAPAIPPRKTVVKPVTSTFIGWNVSGYKRIPVANVNPIKVKDGTQPTPDLMTSTDTVTPFSQLNGVTSQSQACSPSLSMARIPSPRIAASGLTSGMSKTSSYTQPCLILPKPTFQTPNANQGLFVPVSSRYSAGIMQVGIQPTSVEPIQIAPDQKAAVVPQKDGVSKPKKRKKAKDSEGKTKQPKDKSSKPKTKKLKVKAEGTAISTEQVDGGSSSVDAKTEAIKAILRDDFKTKVTEFDAQPSSSQAGSPVPKRSKSVITKKGVCFHSEEESDTRKDVLNEPGVDGEIGVKVAAPGKEKKKRKRSKMLVKQKGHGTKRKLKPVCDELEEGSYTLDQEVSHQEVCTTVADCGENPTGKLVVKISKKKRKKKSKVTQFDSNRERGSQIITYNKNAKYEQELLREEERRLVLKAKRNARKSVRSDSSFQSEAGCYGDGFKYTDEDSWQQGGGVGFHGKGGGSGAAEGPQEEIQYEVESRPITDKQRQHTGLKLKRIVRKAMAEEQMEAGAFADEEDSGFPRRRLKRRRRRRWYKKRKSFVYLPVNYQFCMGEVDDTQCEGGSTYAPLDDPAETEGLGDQDTSLQDNQYVDPELVSELKGVITRTETGETKLHRLTRMGHQDLAIRCIEASLFSVNARDHAGYTPLHESCATGRLRVAKSLLQHGADVNIAAQDGTRPLHDAVDHNRLELVRLLLSHGADPHITTYSGKTPLRIARTPDMQRLIKGHLQDVGGVEVGKNVDMWSFVPPWEDRELEHVGCHVLNAPTDCSSGEEDMEFELWDSAPLTCHHLTLDQQIGPRNYYFLHDLSSFKDIPEDDFKLLNFDLNYQTATKESLSHLSLFDDSNHTPVSKHSKKIDFVEAGTSLKSLLEIDRCSISRAELMDGNLNDVSFSETPTERLLLEASLTTDAAVASDLSTTAFCSRKLDFSKSDATSLSSVAKCPDDLQNCDPASSTEDIKNNIDVNMDNSQCSTSNISDSHKDIKCSDVVGPGGDNGLAHDTGKAKETEDLACSSGVSVAGGGDCLKTEREAKEETKACMKECSNSSPMLEKPSEDAHGNEEKGASCCKSDRDLMMDNKMMATKIKEEPTNEMRDRDVEMKKKIFKKENYTSSQRRCSGSISDEDKHDALSQGQDSLTINKCVSSEISKPLTHPVPSTSALSGDPMEETDEGSNKQQTLLQPESKVKLEVKIKDEEMQSECEAADDKALPVLKKELNEEAKTEVKTDLKGVDTEKDDKEAEGVKSEDMPSLSACV